VIKTVLAALDRSARAPAVLSTAAVIAEATGARLCLLRVLDLPPEFPPAAHVAHPYSLQTVARRQAEQDLLDMAGSASHLVATYSVVEAAEPWRAILDGARSVAADLLVIGTHGRHGLERILGTTASRIINHADRDVLVVHPR
jgi:nucleotide-binding universal stress UspA family protein